ncbi:F-box-like domain superfamily [Arabidopsis suecica]|uniref:F-box-like domain superfamily n=1 Tax=Arabidopsis suecica TaxID=45249 RepID=A0A8T2HIK6_ARASU|nr:F-box-like domain superfamily [Arabidopsis suecica]
MRGFSIHMGEAGRKRVPAKAKRSRKRKREVEVGVDWISDLLEALLCKVLLNLPTKDVVRTSVFSKRWKNLWKRNYQIEYFKLSYPGDGSSEREVDLLKRWIDTVIQLKVKHLDFFDYSWEWGFDNFQLPPTIYTCESLLSLKLSTVTLPSVKSVSLPFLRVLKLGAVKFADHLDLETLISGCTALETLAIRFFDRVQVLQVCSQSLLSFTHVAPKLVFTHAARKPLAEKDLSIVIDAPRLEYLKLSDHQTASFIIKNPGSLVAVDIDINLSSGFDSRNMIRDFLVGISSVKNMTISSITLKIIYDYLRCEPLPPHSVIYISCMLSSTTTGLKCCQPFLRSAQI